MGECKPYHKLVAESTGLVAGVRYECGEQSWPVLAGAAGGEDARSDLRSGGLDGRRGERASS